MNINRAIQYNPLSNAVYFNEELIVEEYRTSREVPKPWKETLD